jgi:hypothetical protein
MTPALFTTTTSATGTSHTTDLIVSAAARHWRLGDWRLDVPHEHEGAPVRGEHCPEFRSWDALPAALSNDQHLGLETLYLAHDCRKTVTGH